MSPDTTVRTAGHVASHTNHLFNRSRTLLNYAYEMESNGEDRDQRQDWDQDHEREQNLPIQEELINEATGNLSKEGQNNLNRLYVNNEKFRDEIINFVKNKMQLDLEAILDRRYKTNTLNLMGKNYLAECIVSKDNIKDLNEILDKYVGIPPKS